MPGFLAREHRRGYRMSAAWLASTALAIGLIGTGSAQAQTTSQSSADTASDQAIIVTGSRLGRTTFDTPTPVTVLGGDNLKQLAITNVGVGLNQLPAFRASTSPANSAAASASAMILR